MILLFVGSVNNKAILNWVENKSLFFFEKIFLVQKISFCLLCCKQELSADHNHLDESRKTIRSYFETDPPCFQ